MRRAGGCCSCLGGDAAGGQVPFGEQAQGWDGSVVIVGFHLGGGWGLVAGQVIKAAADGDKTDQHGTPTNSIALTLRYALGLLAHGGHGAIVCPPQAYRTDLAQGPEQHAIYARLPVSDMFPTLRTQCGIAFFSEPHHRHRGPHHTHELPPVSLTQLQNPEAATQIATTIRDINHLSRRFAPLRMAGERMKRPLEQVNEEYTARLHQRVGGTSTHNLTLAAGRIRLTISGFLAAGVGTHDAEMLRDLHTKPVGYLAINRRHWATIVSHINAGRLTVRTTAAGSCLASVRGCKIE